MSSVSAIVKIDGKTYVPGTASDSDKVLNVVSSVKLFNTTCNVLFFISLILIGISSWWIFTIKQANKLNLSIVAFVALSCIGLSAGSAFAPWDDTSKNNIDRVCLFIPNFVLAICVFFACLASSANGDTYTKSDMIAHNLTLSFAVAVIVIGTVLTIHTSM